MPCGAAQLVCNLVCTLSPLAHVGLPRQSGRTRQAALRPFRSASSERSANCATGVGQGVTLVPPELLDLFKT